MAAAMDGQDGQQMGQQMALLDRLQALRADFALVRAWMVEYEEWSVAQAAEVGAYIGEVVKEGEAGELVFWAGWMANMATVARQHRAGMAKLEREAALWAMEMRRAA